MNGFHTVLGAIAPVFLLIVLGHLFRRAGFLAEPLWRGIEKLTYYILFPSLIVDNLARADLGGLPVLPMAAALMSALLLVSLILFALRRRLGVDGPAFSSLFQGSVRPNTYIGLATVAALFQGPGLTLCAIGLATVVPLVNVLCVAVLTRYGAGNRPGIKGAVTGIATNPIVVGVVTGILLNRLGFGHVPVIGPTLKILGDAALPLGLLAIGAGLHLDAARSAGRAVATAAVLKMAVAPVLTALVGLAAGLDSLLLTVAMLFNALPAAPASHILARQMGGDHQLMAGVITTQTVLAALTLPLLLALLA